MANLDFQESVPIIDMTGRTLAFRHSVRIPTRFETVGVYLVESEAGVRLENDFHICVPSEIVFDVLSCHDSIYLKGFIRREPCTVPYVSPDGRATEYRFPTRFYSYLPPPSTFSQTSYVPAELEFYCRAQQITEEEYTAGMARNAYLIQQVENKSSAVYIPYDSSTSGDESTAGWKAQSSDASPSGSQDDDTSASLQSVSEQSNNEQITFGDF